MPKKLNIGTSTQSAPNDRNGLGYGVLKPSGRWEPRQSGDNFPYRDEPEKIDPIELETAEEIDNYNRINNKFLAYISKSDFYAAAGTNPFSFVNGNTKLSESPAKGMVPFPNLYKNAIFGASASPVRFQGPSSGYSTLGQTFGSKKGYAKAIETDTQKEMGNNVESYAELFNMSSEDMDEKHIKMLRKKIKSIIEQN